MKKFIVLYLAITVIILAAVSGCAGPKPTPGLSHLSKARVYSDDSIEIKPGETKTIEFTLETRKDGPGIFKIGGISHVSGEYSDAIILPMPEGLGINLEPESFMAYPDSTYKSVCTITTSPELAPGEYWLHFDQEFERSFRGYGLIRVTVKRLEITTAEVGQVLDIRVEPSPGTSLTKGILLDHTIVKIGSLDRSGFILQNREHYYVGDRCLLVLGDMRNDTDEDLYVDLWAEGFDSRERQVAWSISSGTIIGHVQFYIPHQSSESFEITLNWAEDVQLIKIIAHSYDRMIPSRPESK